MTKFVIFNRTGPTVAASSIDDTPSAMDYFESARGTAEMLDSVPFLKVMITFVLFAGVASMGYFGVRGLMTQETYVAGYRRIRRVTGMTALVAGGIYLMLIPGLLALLGPLCFYFWLG